MGRHANAKLHATIAAMLATQHETGITQREIAAQAKCSVSTVQVVKQGLMKSGNTGAKPLPDLIENALPLHERIKLLADIARSSRNDAARLSALQRLDHLAGYFSDLEASRISNPEDKTRNQIAFIFPAGTQPGLAPQALKQLREELAANAKQLTGNVIDLNSERSEHSTD